MSPAYASEQSCFKKLWQLSPENTLACCCRDPGINSWAPTQGPGTPRKPPWPPSPPSPCCCALSPTSHVTARALTLQEGIRACNFQPRNRPICGLTYIVHTHTHSHTLTHPQSSQSTSTQSTCSFYFKLNFF